MRDEVVELQDIGSRDDLDWPLGRVVQELVQDGVHDVLGLRCDQELHREPGREGRRAIVQHLHRLLHLLMGEILWMQGGGGGGGFKGLAEHVEQRRAGTLPGVMREQGGKEGGEGSLAPAWVLCALFAWV